MFCRNCGTELRDEANFCKNCGNSTKEIVENVLPRKEPPRDIEEKFSFGVAFMYSTLISFLVLLIPTILMDGFENDGAGTFIGILFISAIIGLIITLVRKAFSDERQKVTTAPTAEEILKYKGLEGWLTLVILGLLVTLGYGVYIFTDAIFSNSISAGSIIFLYDILNGFITATLSGYVIYLYFKRKKEFKKYYIVLWLYMVMQGVITYALVYSYTTDATLLAEYSKIVGKNFWGALIWIWYVSKSKRVKVNFVE
jgi:hypothetical protein